MAIEIADAEGGAAVKALVEDMIGALEFHAADQSPVTVCNAMLRASAVMVGRCAKRGHEAAMWRLAAGYFEDCARNHEERLAGTHPAGHA